jgi:hypothetical protein
MIGAFTLATTGSALARVNARHCRVAPSLRTPQRAGPCRNLLGDPDQRQGLGEGMTIAVGEAIRPSFLITHR